MTSLVTHRSARSMAVSISDLLSDSDFNSDEVENSLASSAAAMLAFPKRSTTAKYRQSYAAETRFGISDGGVTTKDDTLILDSLDGGMMVEAQFEGSNVFVATSSDDNNVQKLDEGGDNNMEQIAGGETESNSYFNMNVTGNVWKERAWQDNEGDFDVDSSVRTESQSKSQTIRGTDLLRGESENFSTGEMNDLERLLASTLERPEYSHEINANTQSFEKGMENTESNNYKAIGINNFSDEKLLDGFVSEHKTRLRQMVKFSSEDIVIEEFDQASDLRESEVLVQSVVIDNKIEFEGNIVNLQSMSDIKHNLVALEGSSNISSVSQEEKNARLENQLVEEGMSGNHIVNGDQFNDQNDDRNEFFEAGGSSNLEEFDGAGSPLNTARELTNLMNERVYEESAEQDALNSFSDDELVDSPDELIADIEMGIIGQTILEQYTDEEAEAGSNPRSAVGKLDSGLGKFSSNAPVKVSMVDEERQDEDSDGNDDSEDIVKDGNIVVRTEDGISAAGESITAKADLSVWGGGADDTDAVNEPNSQANTCVTVTESWKDVNSFPSVSTVENNASDSPFEVTAFEHNLDSENLAEMQVESLASEANEEEGIREESEPIDIEDINEVSEADDGEQSDKKIGDSNEVVNNEAATDIDYDCVLAPLDVELNNSDDKSRGNVNEIKREEITEPEGGTKFDVSVNETHIISENAVSNNADMEANDGLENETSGDGMDAAYNVTEHRVNGDINEVNNDTNSDALIEASNEAIDETSNETVSAANSNNIDEASNEATDEAINDTVNEANSDAINEDSNEAIYEASNDSVNEAWNATLNDAYSDVINTANNDTVNEANSDAVNCANTEEIDEASNDTVNEANNDAIIEVYNDVGLEANNDFINEASNDAEINGDDINGRSNETVGEDNGGNVNEGSNDTVHEASNETLNEVISDVNNEENNDTVHEASNDAVHEASNDTENNTNNDVGNEASNEEVNCENENYNENEDEHINKIPSPEPDEVSLKNELNEFISQQFSRSGTPLEDLEQNTPTLPLPRTPTVIHEALSGVS